MAVYKIPLTATTSPSTRQETSFDGVSYLLTVRWNERESNWYLTIEDLEGDIVAASIKLVEGVALLRHFKIYDVPQGFLCVFNNTDSGVDPGRDDFSAENSVLLYIDDAEVNPPSTGTATEV